MIVGACVHIQAIDLGNQLLGFHIGNVRLGFARCRDEIRTVENTSDGLDAAHQEAHTRVPFLGEYVFHSFIDGNLGI